MPLLTTDDSVALLRDLRLTGLPREEAVARLHHLLLRVAHAEAHRRRPRLPERTLAEVDDLCHQATSDAVILVLQKLDDFRGLARFTTWASKFAILGVSTMLRRHAWSQRIAEAGEVERLQIPDQAPSPLGMVEYHELSLVLQQAVDQQLTDHQRTIFQAAAVDDIPIDVLAERFASSRGAIYKTLHDARRKLRRVLADAGYAEQLT